LLSDDGRDNLQSILAPWIDIFQGGWTDAPENLLG